MADLFRISRGLGGGVALGLLGALGTPMISNAQSYFPPEIQAQIRQEQAVRDLNGIIDEAIRANGGANFIVTRTWGYINADSSLLFCGIGREEGRAVTFVIFMDGKEEDVVGFEVPLDKM